MSILVILALAVFNLALFLVIILILVRRWGGRVLQQLRDETALRGEDGVRGDGFANFRGLLSDGIPMRGNAAVLLTAQRLHVVRLWPRRAFSVPIERMTWVEVTRSFMGMRRAHGFLVVHFTADGGADAIGLTMRDVLGWFAAVGQLAKPYVKGPPGGRGGDGVGRGGGEAGNG